ncbi:hypothetical protein IV102_20300 [bacterium]|nr:hypothetical protein [bacterium]
MKPTPSSGGGKPGLGKSDAKSALGAKGAIAKDLPTKGASSRNLLSIEDVSERLRVFPGHVEQWLKEGILKGSLQGVQLYELEKFRAKHHRDIVQAQSAPAPASSKGSKTPVKKSPSLESSGGQRPVPTSNLPPVVTTQPPFSKKKSSNSPLQLVADVIKSIFSLGKSRSAPKPEKVAPYVHPHEDDDSHKPVTQRQPTEPEFKFSPIHATANIPASAFQAVSSITGELVAPPPPSGEVWPSLEGTTHSAETPSWLTTSVEASEEPPGQHETLILKADQIMAAMKGQAQGQPVAGNLGRELHEEKQRNQQLLLQLQDQRRAELEIQDEVETLKQRLELSLSSEREVRSQLKRSRQELQTALEELEQRPPAGDADPEELKQLQAKEAQWAAEKIFLEQQRTQLDQRKTLLEQQIERLRSQAEEIRQHGLQWHQLATQQDQQLRTLRQQHGELEQEAGKALGELEKKLRDSEAQKARAETNADQLQHKVASLETQIEQLGKEGGTADLQLDNKAKERALQQIQVTVDNLQKQMITMETQQRSQVQRWEQELQASASWVQKLTEAVSARDRRIQELETQVAQSSSKSSTYTEDELKSQVMSLRVELTSLRRNYEIVSLQAKNLEIQLQDSRRASPPTATSAQSELVGAALPTSPDSPSILSLDLPGNAGTDEEGGFRRRLKQRLGSLGPSFEEESRKRGLEPPPFLELDIPET